MEFAYGTMGLSPVEFAALTPFQFDLKCKGYTRKLDDDELSFRKLAWIIFALNADPKASKRMNIDDLWPRRSSIGKKKAAKSGLTTKVNTALAAFRNRQNLKQKQNEINN